MLTRIAFKAPSPISYLVRKISRIAASVACSLAGKPWLMHLKKRLVALEAVFAFFRREFYEVFSRKDEVVEIWGDLGICACRAVWAKINRLGHRILGSKPI